MNEKIIIVDDNIASLEAGARLLSPFYKVYPARSAVMLFSMLEKVQPDLILLDVMMPEMDGYEALAKLKGNPRFSDIPVVFLTASADEKIEFKGIEMGAVGYISKPFSADLLLRYIEIHTAHKNQAAP